MLTCSEELKTNRHKASEEDRTTEEHVEDFWRKKREQRDSGPAAENDRDNSTRQIDNA